MTIYQQILTKYWGYSTFRPLQEDIIKSVAQGKDTLGLMPTGGGKSITFQIPALAKDGLCIVVTPLIALMKDQVKNLQKKGIKAVAVFTGMTQNEIEIALNNCIYGDYKFLYLSPERLGTEVFLTLVKKMNVNLIAVDESHCISQWGYDFRPSYLKIAEIKEYLPDVPVLALTATATPEVADDIQDKLHFKEKNLLKKSFERKNLVYIVRDVEDKLKKLLEIANIVKGSGLVYVKSRKKTKEVAQYLIKNKITADFYHAGLDNKARDRKQSEWTRGKIRIIVATNAFGMGIDKANVRFVVHFDLPDSIEAYFQEAGRCGRDEKKAYAVLLYNKSDKINLEKTIATSFPELKTIKKVYQALGNYYNLPVGSGKNQVFDFKIYDFASKFSLNVLTVYSSLKIIQQEGYLELTDELFNPSKIHFTVNREELYKFQVSNAALDGFIKLLLRLHSGVFTDYVKIDEYSLAKKANITIEAAKKYLQNLNSLNIINYIPQKKTPLIMFTEERMEDKSLFVSKKDYEARKKRYITRANAVMSYASSDNKCRSQILLSYFGEKDPYRCGKCDVCMRRNELNLSKYEFDIILEKIKETIKKEAVLLDDLVDNIPYLKNKVLKVIQWLIDNNKITKLEDNKMVWNS